MSELKKCRNKKRGFNCAELCAGCALSSGRERLKQRVRFDDAMAMIRKSATHKFRKRFPGHTPPDNVDSIIHLNRSEIENVIRKLTRP